MAWRYRDTLTGRWVSEETYLRSTSHGGSRYGRESDAEWGQGKDKPQSLDDWYDTSFDTDDFGQYDEFDGGIDYGETT